MARRVEAKAWEKLLFKNNVFEGSSYLFISRVLQYSARLLILLVGMCEGTINECKKDFLYHN